jgi:uncharacterized membrane protein YfcA
MLLWVALAILVVVTFGAGFLGSLTGLGGGVIVVPVLAIFFNVPFVEAVGASAVTVLATSSTTGAAYVRDHLTDLKIGMFLEIATVPGAFVGAVSVIFLARLGLVPALLVALGVVLLLTIPPSLLHHRQELPHDVVADARSQRLHLEGSYYDVGLGESVPYRAANTNEALGVMFGAGVVSGMFGIGSGVLKVLALDGALKLPMKVATATSNFMIGVTVAAGAGVLLAAGYIDPVLAGPVAIGTAGGAYLGTRVLPSMSNRAVRYVFLPVLAGLAIELILRGLGLT